jgi:pyruvate dehydrogenase E2 component (dihydrolipoamide acetyltransferase)
MAHVLIMPRQGNTVESCIIVDWKVKEGDSVAADTIICDVETDKATFEVPAGEAGLVLKLLREAGDDVPVLEPIAVIGRAGEDWRVPGAVPGEPASGAASERPPASERPVSGTAAEPPAGERPAAAPAAGRAAASPRARNLAAKEGVPLNFPGSGPGGRIIERDVLGALQNRPALTSAARAALAASPDRGDLPAEGSGLGGRIGIADLGAVQAPAADASPSQVSGGEGRITDTPIKGIRRVIADRMFRSLAESAQFTLNAAAPVSRMQELRARLKASDETRGLSKVTVNDLILFAVSRTLPLYPFMNAHKIGGKDVLRTFERVHLGVAVDTPRGLMVPVIRNADLLSLREISSEAKRLAAACQGGSVKPGELSGSTFTVTNLGSLGVTGFTPILNTPEVGILGVCGIELRPVAAPATAAPVPPGGAVFEPHIGLSLTINHQVVDGAPAARFLKALSGAIADIDLWLIG